MPTDWEGLVAIALFFAVPWAACTLISHLADSNFEHRFGDPQVGPVEGTGVERTPPTAGVVAVPAPALPRSPQSPAGTADPRPGVPAGPQLPGGCGGPPPRPALPGLQRVTVHG